jgi:tetratricopeptide (TPR) repeat protein
MHMRFIVVAAALPLLILVHLFEFALCAPAAAAAMRVRAKAVNLSRLVVVHEELRPSVPELVSPSDPATRRVLARLRALAEAELQQAGRTSTAAGAAITCSPSVAQAWNTLGVALGAAERIRFADGGPSAATGGSAASPATKSKLDCFVMALTCDPRNARAWYNAAMLLASPASEAAELVVEGERFDRVASLARAVAADPEHSEAWAQLGLALRRGETVPVAGGERVGKVACFRNALRTSSGTDDDAATWVNLGNAMSAEDEAGGSVTRRECYARALAIDPTLTVALYNLGTSMRHGESVTVGDRALSKLDCLLAAMADAHDDAVAAQLRSSATAWTSLGDALTLSPQDYTVTVAGQPVTRRKCYERALAIDGARALAWSGLGSLLPHVAQTRRGDAAGAGATSAGEDATQADAADIAAARFVPGPGFRGDVSQRAFSRRDCFAEALRHDRSLAIAWVHLGDDIGLEQPLPPSSPADDTASAVALDDGKRVMVTRRRAYSEALALDPTDAHSWHELGTIAHAQRGSYAALTVAGRRVTARDCFVRAIEADVDDADSDADGALPAATAAAGGVRAKQMRIATLAYYNLGVALAADRGAVARVRGEVVAERDCFLRALALDRRNCAAWNALGNNITTDGERVDVPVRGGRDERARAVGRTECYVEAVLCDPEFSSAWLNLGTTLRKADAAVIVGQLGPVTMRQCFERAIASDPANHDAWYNVGLLLQGGDTIDVVGFGRVDRARCFAIYDSLRGGASVESLRGPSITEPGGSDL